MPKKDLRVIKTIQQIDSAFLTILTHTPFSKMKIDQLCHEAMINRSTFYTYYEDKFDLLEKYLSKILNEFQKQVDVAFVKASPQNINDIIYQKNFEKVLTFLYSHKKDYLILWDIPLERNIFSEMITIVYNSILDNLNVEKITSYKFPYADLYARLFASNMMTLVKWWFLNENEVHIHDVQEIMTSNMKQGMFQTFRKYMDQ